MIRRVIVISGLTYAVQTEQAFRDLKEHIVSAALAGAGLVELPSWGDRTVTVLITPHVLVTFEERQVDDGHQVTENGVEYLGDDLDEFGEFES